jgi:vitamin B12 transporter
MRNAHRALTMTCALATAGVGISAATAVAQDSEILPAIVVEGATLDAATSPKPKAQKKQAAKEVPVGEEKPDTNSTGAPSQPLNEGQVEAEALTGPSPGTDDSVQGVPIRKLGTPVSVVTGEDIRARQIRNAVDAIRSLPGVAVSNSGGGGQNVQVRIRGAEGNHTLVIIDGVEANDTNSGEFDFANLSADDIERIEVLRGVQSGLYGSRAIGGVINIITKGGKGPLTFRSRAEGGSFGTRDVAGSVSAGNDRGYFAASYNFQEADGFNISETGNEKDGWERQTFNLRSGASIVEGISVDFNLRRSNLSTQFDTTNFFAPNFVPQTPVDSGNLADTSIWLGGGKVTWQLFDGGFTQVVGGNFNSTTSDQTDDFGTSTYENTRERFYYLSTARFGSPQTGMKHAVSGLAEKEMESFTPSASFTDSLERNRERTAFAAEYRGEYLDRIFPTASIRHEDNDTFQDFTTWKTALSVDMHELGFRPHASVGTAVATPGMFEQFGSVLGAFIGNPNLIPEESFGWDAGVEFYLLNGQAAVDVTYFDANLENEIVTVGNTVVNIQGESQRRGVEVAARWLFSPNVTIGAAYTWLQSADPSGVSEIRRPEHTARADVNYTFADGRGTLNVAGFYNGATTDLAFFNLPPPDFFGSSFVDLDSYFLLNAAASYQLSPGVQVFGRVENALNEDYQDVFGFETADIAAYVGLRFTYVEEATRAWAEGR